MVAGISSAMLIELVRQHGVLAVMAAALIEEIVVPIPSPVVPMAAGAILVTAPTAVEAALEVFFLIALPASIASVLSSYFVYGIAYFGGKPAIERYGRYLDFTWEELQHLEQHFGGEREKYYVFGFRAVPVVPLSLVSGAAGLFRMDWKQYGVWSFLGMMPRNFTLGMIGWYFSDSFRIVASHIDSLSTAVAVGAAVLVGGYFLYRFLDRKVKEALFS